MVGEAALVSHAIEAGLLNENDGSESDEDGNADDVGDRERGAEAVVTAREWRRRGCERLRSTRRLGGRQSGAEAPPALVQGLRFAPHRQEEEVVRDLILLRALLAR